MPSLRQFAALVVGVAAAIVYGTLFFFSTLHSYDTHFIFFGLLFFYHHYILSYNALGIHTTFSIYINLPSLAYITSVVYSL